MDIFYSKQFYLSKNVNYPHTAKSLDLEYSKTTTTKITQRFLVIKLTEEFTDDMVYTVKTTANSQPIHSCHTLQMSGRDPINISTKYITTTL